MSADGKLLAYSEAIRDWNIRFLSLDGSATSLTFPNTPKSERQAMFSPDGRWLAYTSDESGRWEVYLRPLPNLASARQQVSREGGEEPRWTRGGREITFRSGPRMMAVSIDPATGAPGQPAELFSGPFVPGYPVGTFSYDVTADGSKFLMAKPQLTGVPSDVVVVVNWFAELNRSMSKK